MLIYEVITVNVGIMNQVIGIWVDTIKENKRKNKVEKQEG
jgi:hypothetical protein